MAKRADVSLTVTAKNLAKKDLREISTLLDGITKAQNEQASSAGLAARSINQLKTEERELAAAMRELERRNKIVDKFREQQVAVKSLSATLAEMRQKLNDLKSGTAVGFELGSKKAAAEIRKTTAELGRLEAKTKSAINALTKTGAVLDEMGVDTKQAATSFARLNAESARTRGLIEANASAFQRYDAAIEEVNDANARNIVQQREIAAEAKRRTQIELAETRRRMAAAQAEIADRARRAGRIQDAKAAFGGGGLMDQEAAAANRLAAADARLLGIEQRFAEVLARKTAAQRTALGVTAAGIPVINRDAAATRAAAVSKDRYGTAAQRAAVAGTLFADTGRKSLSVYQRMRGQLLQIGAAYLGIYQAVNLVTSSIQTEQRRAALRTQMLVVENNNAARATETYRFLRQEADRLGLQFEDLAKNYASYAISARAAGLTTQQIRDTFIGTATSVVGLRLSAEDAEGVFRAMGQIMGKARVQAEELRGQLGDRLPGAVAAFAKANNIALTDLDELLKKGKVGVQELINFITDYEKQFQATLPQTTSTLIADLNRLKNVYNDFLELLAKGGTSKALQDTINQLKIFFKSTDGVKFAQDLSTAFVFVIDVIRLAVKHFSALVLIIKLFLALNIAKAFYGIGLGLASFIGNIVKARTALIAYRTATLAAAAGTGALSVAARGLLLALGPIGIALAVVSAAVIYLATQESKAEKAAKKHAEEIDELTLAMNSNKRAAVILANATHAQAVADLAAAEAALAHAEAENAKRVQLELSLRHSRRISTGGAVDTKGPAAEIAELKEHVAKVREIRAQSIRDYMNFLKDEAAIQAEVPNIALPKTDDDDAGEKAADAAKKLAEERKKLEEEVAAAIMAIDRDLLQAQQSTLDQRLALIDFDINARIAELEKLKALAMEQGQPAEAVRVEGVIKQIEVLRELEKVEATRAFNQEKIAENEEKINDLLQQREQIIETVNLLQAAGAITATQAHQKIEDANNRLLPQIDQLVIKAQEFIASLGNSPEAQAAQLTLDNIMAKVIATRNELTQTQRVWMNLGTTLAGGIVDTIGVLAKGLAGAITGANSLADAFKGARDAFLNFAADFLIQIGQMILKAILLQALQNFISGGKGGFMDAVLGAFSQHTGGVVGKDGRRRDVAASAFIGAQRFHEGGMPGLKSNEVATVLEKGEEVITENDERHIANGGGMAGAGARGAPMEVTVMNSIDSVDMLQKAAGTPAGKQVIFNVVRSNRAEFKQLLGVPG